jgi:hypothetical protein
MTGPSLLDFFSSGLGVPAGIFSHAHNSVSQHAH